MTTKINTYGITPATITASNIASGTITSTQIASSTIGLSNLTATGTASSTTFLRGDNTWNSPLAGSGPTFSVSASAAQTISNSTLTKMQFNTKSFDTNNNFDATTNYRFTPTVAGYYQINATINYQGGTAYSSNFMGIYIYKNGSNYNPAAFALCSFASAINTVVIYLNGSTDYSEIYCQQGSGSSLTIIGINFSGSLIRTA
jgi:hypothetical protein